MFLDESGDHSLTKIDPQYPLFILAGVIIDKDYESSLEKVFQAFKQKLFGTKDIILHTADITRNRNGFEKLKDSSFRQQFYSEINQLIDNLDFKIVACAIRKVHHLEKYGLEALDPYLLSLNVLLERFYFELKYKETNGYIIAESRHETLDNELELAFLNLKISGTLYVSGTNIKNRINAFNIRDKKENIAGLQLADLVVTPVGRYVLGKKIKEDFRIIERKFRRFSWGGYKGPGLVILPK
jgi:hypothetical protein